MHNSQPSEDASTPPRGLIINVRTAGDCFDFLCTRASIRALFRPTVAMRPSLLLLTVALILCPSPAGVLRAAGRYAVFKSVDSGRSWVRADKGIAREHRINAFGSLGKAVVAGTDSGIYISLDGAEDWQPVTGAAQSSRRIISFVAQATKLFAGTDGQGMLVSSDTGMSWVVNRSFSSKKVRCLLAHKDLLYAGTDTDGVFSSTDGGQSWSSFNEGLPANAQIFAMSMAGDRLFAGLYSKGLYVWKEPEQRWTRTGPVRPLALATMGTVLIAGHNPGGIFWSEDSGAPW
ncbi:MAG: hypothetical protein FJ405_13275, partial [Verrucomicrobia bacterium]|nr:hypothetical protein [Verrucomicrobiota bacterium]